MSSRLKRKLVLDYISYILAWGFVVLQGCLIIMFTEKEWVLGVALIAIAVVFIIGHTKYVFYIAIGNVSIALSRCADKKIHGNRFASYYIYPISLSGVKFHHLRTLSDFGIKVSYWTYRKIKKGDRFVVIATPSKVKCYPYKYSAYYKS